MPNDLPNGAPQVHVYDTTLRDGAQQEGLNLTVSDKLAIATQLDALGVGFIEAGWPGANPKDTEVFARAKSELRLRNAVLCAFGSTRRAGLRAADDPQVLALLAAQTPVVTLVAKSHRGHVERALRTTPAENLAMIADTVSLLVGEGRRVFVDAEHFFDGYLDDPEHGLAAVRTAAEAGAEAVVLCDTNGGMLPEQVGRIVGEVADTGVRLGIHAHNDSGCAVANSIAAVQAGATHVQGTVNGYGERTGNADLITCVSNLQLKLGHDLVSAEQLSRASSVAHAISELTTVAPYRRQPYVGQSAFAHKAGLHASALKVDPDLYQHIDPALVGNAMRTLVSDMAGRASVELRARELGLDLSERPELVADVVRTVKSLEQQGWTFDAADASFALLLRRMADPGSVPHFEVEGWRAISDSAGSGAGLGTEATVKLTAGGRRRVAAGEGNGPVHALDHALRQALETVYPELAKFELVDFRVRILDASRGTDATTRVLIETTDGAATWCTVGVAANVVDASWMALCDSFTFGLVQAGVAPR